MLGLTCLWNYAIQSVRWNVSTIHSHAAALVLINFFWILHWIAGQKEKLLKTQKLRSKKKMFLHTPSSSSSDYDGDNTTNEEKSYMHDLSIEKKCPDATPMERRRFLTARQGDVPGAIKTLSCYLDWLTEHDDITREHKIEVKATGDKDVDVWAESCAVAMMACEKKKDSSNLLPRVIRTHQIDGVDATDKSGQRIFHIIPAQMDDQLASTYTYALATALYINKHLDREGLERITVCMDVRAGRGWPNIHAMRLVPFMKQTTTLLLSLFPERLHKCVIYPVPSTFLWIWNLIAKVIDPLTKDKICLLSGVNKIEAAPPLDQMSEHLGEKVALLLEASRVAAFKD